MVHVMLGDSSYYQIKTTCRRGSQLGKLYLRKQHLAFHRVSIVENTKTGRESTVSCEFVFG